MGNHFLFAFLNFLNDFLVRNTSDRFKKYSIGNLGQNPVSLHNNLILKDFRFVRFKKILFTPALTLAGYDCSIFEFFQTALDDDDDFLKPRNTFSEYRLIGFERGNFHGLNYFLCLGFVQFTQQRIFLKGPLNKVSESDIIYFITQNSVQSVSSKNQTSNLIIGLNC